MLKITSATGLSIILQSLIDATDEKEVGVVKSSAN